MNANEFALLRQAADALVLASGNLATLLAAPAAVVPAPVLSAPPAPAVAPAPVKPAPVPSGGPALEPSVTLGEDQVAFAIGNLSATSDADFGLHPVAPAATNDPDLTGQFGWRGFTLTVSDPNNSQSFLFSAGKFLASGIAELMMQSGAAAQADTLLNVIMNARDISAPGQPTLKDFGVTGEVCGSFSFVDNAGATRSVPMIVLSAVPGCVLKAGVGIPAQIGVTTTPTIIEIR